MHASQRQNGKKHQVSFHDVEIIFNTMIFI